MPSNEYFSGIHKTLKDKAYTRLNGSKQTSERDQIQKSILKSCRHQKEENGVPIFNEDGKPEMSKYISNAEYAKISTNHKGRERSVLSLQKTHKPLENGYFKKRLIVDNAGSASDELEKSLYDKLKVVEQKMPTLLKSTNEVLGRFLNFTVPNDFDLVSTDIEDMYSSINATEAIYCLIEFVKRHNFEFDTPSIIFKNF